MNHSLLPSAAASDPSGATGLPGAVLDRQQSAFLLQLLVGNDPLHLHFETPLWTPQAITEVVYDEFDRRLSSAEVQRCLFELGLIPADPLLRVAPAQRHRYERWIAAELPRRIGSGKISWWVSEHLLQLGEDRVAQATLRPRNSTAIAAINDNGQMVWWFCRGVADVRMRAEFIARLCRLSPDCALLTCGMAQHYAEASALMAPTHAPLTLELDNEVESTSGDAASGLFRHEVFQARGRRIEGEVMVLQPLPTRLLTAGVLLVLIALGVLGSFGHYARTQNAVGVLMPSTGVLRLRATQAGVVQSLHAAVGDRVSVGQTMARIVSTALDGDGAAVDARVVAELEQSLVDLAHEEHDLLKHGKLEQQRLQDALNSAKRQRNELSEQRALQLQRQHLHEDNLARSKKLAERGVIARVQLQEMEQQTLSEKVQTLALTRELGAASGAVDEARNRMAQQPLDGAQRRDTLRQRRNEITQRLAQARLQAGATLRAPANARVAAILVQPGMQVAAGAPLLILVDDRAPLLAELLVPSRAIGFIRSGQRVQLKLDAFPYQKYGYQLGTIREISGTTVATGDVAFAQTLNEPAYLVRAALDTQTIHAYGEARALNAGMQVQADIVIDRPRIIDWMLEPLRALRGR